MKKYQITCLKCKDSDILTIDENSHQVLLFGKQMNTSLLAARFRKDNQWGFECKCGNDNRLSLVEKDEFAQLVQGDALTVQRIADSLKIDDKLQFEMRAI